ncbi:MAG: class I SAM-dependent methyltransferase [Polyangia bacterium]
MNAAADSPGAQTRTWSAHAKGSNPSYDLRASQIETPSEIVRFFWQSVHDHRPRLGSILDMGAGDGRFAQYGNYDKYTGVELDSTRITNTRPRERARVLQGCVFAKTQGQSFDACIGNPPYLRHQDIESPWKEETIAWLGSELDVELSGHSNLFLYFMALGLIRAKPTGMVALVVPFDWVSRPAARGIRAVIRNRHWNVSVYRFSFPVFDDVETTASVSIIDKQRAGGQWSFYDVHKDLSVAQRRGVTGTGKSLLGYSRRGSLFARRGLSPGCRDVFVLTEGERIHHGLSRQDVLPCVTTLRGVSPKLKVLDKAAFHEQFVRAGRRCWLIRSREKASDPLRRYLDNISPSRRATATCQRQEPWYNYEEVRAPALLLHSGFTSHGPRVLVNAIAAIPLGSMYGIYGCSRDRTDAVLGALQSSRILSRVVPHSGRLKKIEVGQLNSILTYIKKAADE